MSQVVGWRRVSILSSVVLASHGLVACREPGGIHSDQVSADASVQTSAVASERSQLLQRQGRFQLSLGATGPFVPGRPFTVEMKVHGLIHTERATLVVVAPELEQAHRGNPKLSGSLHEYRITPVVEREIAVPEGSTSTLNATLQADLPGYYQVVATLAYEGEPASSDAAIAIQNSVVSELWILVDSAGGRTTLDFARSVFPESVLPATGPFRPRSTYTETVNRNNGTVRTLQGSPNVYRLVYTNADASPPQIVGLPNVWINFTQRHQATGESWGAGGTMTGADGSFWVPCPYDYEWEIDWFAQLTGGGVRMLPLGEIQGGSESAGTCDQGWSSNIQLFSNNLSRVYHNFQRFIPVSQSFFQRTRGTIDVQLLSDGSISRYPSPWQFTPPFYNPDRILIQASGAYAAIWSEYGRFTQAHEYGHALHAVALGGINTQGSCPGSHDFGHYFNIGCAWGEGFASYHALIAFSGELSYYLQYAELHSSRTVGQNGAAGEGDVAAFLYDLTDSAPGEAFDAVALPPWYVLDLIKNCRLQWVPSPASDKVTGVDALIHCLERATVDVQATYFFPVRGRIAVNVTPNVAPVGGGTAAQIRTLWLHDLYSQ